jgi:triosephosphate isomerase
MRQKLVVGNWKMHGGLVSNRALLQGVVAGVKELAATVECAVCVPYPYLAQAQQELVEAEVGWGAQNLSEQVSGAFTGEVSAAMLKDFGCRYVIVGHSERRALYGEDDRLVAKKFKRALAGGLVPILCVGETLAQRESGQTAEVVATQLDAVLDAAGVGVFAGAVVAYEPVWAIGTGLTASPAQAQAVHEGIRARLVARNAEVAAGVRVLYGGSVKAGNAAELFAMPDIDGALVGGASLVAEEFVAICRAAAF